MPKNLSQAISKVKSEKISKIIFRLESYNLKFMGLYELGQAVGNFILVEVVNGSR